MKIETGIEIPSSRKLNQGTYPFAKMNPGDSVFFENEKVGGKAYWAAKNQQKRHGGKFIGRSGGGGIRIWRIE